MKPSILHQRVPRQTARLTEPQLQQLEASHASERGLLDTAIDELRDLVLSAHEHNILTELRNRFPAGEERDLLDRLLEQHAPREAPRW